MNVLATRDLLDYRNDKNQLQCEHNIRVRNCLFIYLVTMLRIFLSNPIVAIKDTQQSYLQSNVGETMGLVLNPQFMRIDTQSPKFLMFESPYTKSGVGLLKKPTFYVVLPRSAGQASLVQPNQVFKPKGPMCIPDLRS